MYVNEYYTPKNEGAVKAIVSYRRQLSNGYEANTMAHIYVYPAEVIDEMFSELRKELGLNEQPT